MKSVKLIGLIISIFFVFISCNKEDVNKHKRLDKITIQMECIIDGETVSYPEVNHMVFNWNSKMLTGIDYYDEGEYGWSDNFDTPKSVETIDPNNIIQSQTNSDLSYSNSTYTYTYRGKLPETRTETVRNGEDVIKYIYHYYYK